MKAITPNAHNELTREAEDRIAIYLLGMSNADTRLFEEHLAICDACRREMTRMKRIVEDLVLAAPKAEPPPGLRERVLALTTVEPSATASSALPATGELRWIQIGRAHV